MDRFWQLLLFLAAIYVLLVPGTLIAAILFPEKRAGERWIWGAAIGLGAATYLSFSLGYVATVLFFPAWAVLTVSAAALWALRRPEVPLWEKPDRTTLGIVVVLVLVTVSRFAVTFVNELPPGWDPTFHLILAQKIALAGGMIDSWEPFENISLNYPVGSHFLVVVLANLTQLPLPIAFKLLIPLIGLFTTAQVYLLAARVTGHQEVATYAGLGYGLWAIFGSIDYDQWGGLPNLLGMFLFMAVLLVLTEDQLGKKQVALLAVLYTAIIFTSSHVMVTAGLILVVLAVSWLAASAIHAGAEVKLRPPRTAPGPAWPDRERGGRLLLGLVGSLVLGSFYIVPYAPRAGTIWDTSIFRFSERFFDLGSTVSAVGGVFLGAALLGLALYAIRRERWRWGAMILTASATLLALFVGSEYVYRMVSWSVYGQEFVMFTPSRFLTDLVYFASVFAGYAWFRIRAWLGVPMGTAMAVGVGLALTNYGTWNELYEPTLSPGRWEAYQWIGSNTPADTIVMDREPWTPYLAWRRTLETPIPVSEPPMVNTPSEHLIDNILAGRLPPDAVPCLVAVRTPKDVGPDPVLWRGASGLVVVQVSSPRSNARCNQ